MRKKVDFDTVPKQVCIKGKLPQWGNIFVENQSIRLASVPVGTVSHCTKDTVPTGTETRAFGHFYKDVVPMERDNVIR